ncbi:MAG: hypothetical protein GY909_12135 [Oligoflexia bacterium]|nr:hypothetical protein [Oligoflexia bacterium]
MDNGILNSDFDFLTQQLDWDVIHKSIIKHTYFDYSKEIFKQPWNNLAYDIESISTDVSMIVNEFHDIHAHFLKSFSSCSEGFNFNQILLLIEKAQVLASSELFEIFILTKNINKFIKKYKNLYLVKKYVKEEFVIFKSFNKECQSLFSEQGHILYSSHPQLAPYYNKIQSLEIDIRTTIKRIHKKFKDTGLTVQDSFDIYNDRFVVAVQSDKYNSKLGIIRGHSKSGFTLYVEPAEVKSLNDILIEERNKLDHELYLIRNHLSQILHSSFEEIARLFTCIFEFDILITKAEYARAHNLSKFIISPGSLKFKNLYHPLIDHPVKSTLEVKNGLLVSGPNTGGKSVLLKSIALALIFAKSGMHVHADIAEGLIPDDIHLLINNTQNLTSGLSSFSLEVNNILSCIDLPGYNAIFIDEIFRSTSSNEASEISYQVLKQAVNNNNSVFVSTHHEILKEKVKNDPFISSGHVKFDLINNKPTYEFILGKPGSSFAIKVFKEIEHSLNQNNNISSRFYTDSVDAEDLTTNEDFSLLEEKYQQQINELNTSHKKEISALNLKLLKSEEKFQNKYDNLNSKFVKLRNSIDSKKNFREELKEIDKISSEIKGSNSVVLSSEETLLPSDLKIGDIVFDKITKKDVEILAIDSRKKVVTILQGKMKVKLPIANLAKSSNTAKKSEVHINVFKENKSSINYDFRGFRLDEFKNELESILIALSSGEIPYADIVYGHGDGILKKELRRVLKDFEEFEVEYPNGDDGSVIIKLVN